MFACHEYLPQLFTPCLKCNVVCEKIYIVELPTDTEFEFFLNILHFCGY